MPIRMIADVDIAIVGDGLVGRPLALSLVARGWRVALIDRSLRAAAMHAVAGLDEEPLDERCTAISVDTRDRLHAEGLWDPVAARAAQIQRVHVSHRGHFGATRLEADDLGLDMLGATVENRCLLASLDGRLQAAIDEGTLVYREGSTLAALQQHETSVTLTLLLANGGSTSVCAGLVIAADGAGSTTRDLLGLGVSTHDYEQAAILTSVRFSLGHDGLAIERFTADGPLALLPRAHGVLNVVACLSPVRAAALAAAPEAEWLAALARSTPRRLGQPLCSGVRVALPLLRIEADAQVSGRCLLLGNAARLLHPVAGQGYNLAMRDVAGWLDALGTKTSAGCGSGAGAGSGADAGEPGRLARFVASRRADQRRTVRLTDGLARAFRGHSALAGHLRGASLVALDMVPPARRAFARRAMGRSG